MTKTEPNVCCQKSTLTEKIFDTINTRKAVNEKIRNTPSVLEVLCQLLRHSLAGPVGRSHPAENRKCPENVTETGPETSKREQLVTFS